MIECFTSERVSGPCSICGALANPAHVILGGESSAIFCGEHCPLHKPAENKWGGEPQTVTGEQAGLFGESGALAAEEKDATSENA